MVVRGDSAYSGSLWLASLRAAEEIAKEAGEAKAQLIQRTLLRRGKRANREIMERYVFPYDTKAIQDNIQADQLAGQCTRT